MKEHYKLAEWSERLQTFVDGKVAHPTREAAAKAITRSGTYRISHVTAAGRADGEPFTLTLSKYGVGCSTTVKAKKYTPAATRPMSGRPH